MGVLLSMGELVEGALHVYYEKIDGFCTFEMITDLA
jgi:hypothetical protein